MIKRQSELESMGSLFSKQLVKPKVKPPAHEWQDFALVVIRDLNIPNFKRASVFQACKKHSKAVIERAVTDTKELCKDGEAWKYFFKILTNLGKPAPAPKVYPPNSWPKKTKTKNNFD
ncbi:hypothetical protein COT94_04275 [Candidatus Falkowbacteria bacterium CG10_big_fil_rev_8_21_14_0_10_37_14]|uniref:Uncharacterized protein n=1 Tax=Candidatus Falkowbacteria bacterium CG10_big_fil_rev_8_21_14_0_10_37_14 TaxID=1974561 RepID=A0A2M6WSL9_9BACT|nr:hypothetical protein [Candidatus Falkowbacteria bacterium]PIT95774.1 MAG: hypothetical protein COT94_04275 [Candidatus Falkowbacteria bacterium CG10_big_fil_rev_8_21_14_0_10_37_14]